MGHSPWPNDQTPLVWRIANWRGASTDVHNQTANQWMQTCRKGLMQTAAGRRVLVCSTSARIIRGNIRFSGPSPLLVARSFPEQCGTRSDRYRSTQRMQPMGRRLAWRPERAAGPRCRKQARQRSRCASARGWGD